MNKAGFSEFDVPAFKRVGVIAPSIEGSEYKL